MWLSKNSGVLIPMAIRRARGSLPQTTQSPLFRVVGRVMITMIIGKVTTAIQDQTDNAKLVSNPSVGGDVDLCAVLDIANDGIGTSYNITGTFTDAMVATTSGAFTSQESAFIINEGTIDLDCSASNTGEIEWILHYIPVEPGSYVTSI